jgi:hypothetical protein
MRAFYRAVVIRKSYEADEPATGKFGFLQAHGRGDPDDPTDVDLVQEADLDHVQHYGFDSHPPADTEIVVAEIDGGEVCLGERYPVPTSLPTRASGDVMIYSLGGHYIWLDDTGNMVLEPVSGRFVFLGSGANKKMAISGDIVVQGSALKTWMDAVTGATGVPAFVGTTLGTITATSAKVKAE